MIPKLIVISFSVFLTAGILFNSVSGSLVYFQDSTVTSSADSLLLLEGKKLYKSKCKKCHALYNPNDYKLKTWKRNLDEMKEKAELNNEDYERIFTYLKANCKK